MANPNHPPTPNQGTSQEKREQIKQGFSFLNVDAVADLRTEQHRLIREAKRGISPFDTPALQQAEQNAMAQFDQVRSDYLDSKKIAKDDPQRGEFEQILTHYSVDRMGDQEWAVGIPDPTTGSVKSGREDLEDVFASFIDEMAGTMPDRVTAPEPVGASPELLEAQDELNVLRDELAEFSAKRIGRFGSKKETKQAFEALQQKYHDKLLEVGKLEEELRKQNYPSRTDADKRKDVMTHLLENEKELRELTNEKLEEKWLDKVAHWLNKGGKLKRAGKGMLVAALPAVAGVAITASLAGIGLVAAGAGIAAGLSIGGKMFLNFARRSTDRRIGVNEVDDSTSQAALDKISDVDNKTHEEIHSETVNKRGEELRGDIKEQQKRRRRTLGKAAIITAATAGAGGLVSYGVQSLFDHVDSDIFEPFREKHYGENGLDSSGGHVYGNPADSGGGSGRTVGSTFEAHPHPDHMPAADATVAPDAPHGVSHSSSSVEHTYNKAAQTISSGEGFYSVFKQMGGIPKGDYQELLQHAGPKLAKLDNGSGQPFAYLINGEKGNWGIRMTADGKMPDGALDTIRSTYEQMKGHSTPQVAEVAPAAPVEHISISPDEITHNDSLKSLTDVPQGVGGREYAQSLGFNPNAWNAVQQNLLQAHPDAFIQMGNDVGLRVGELAPNVAADMFNQLESVNLPSGNSLTLLDTIQPSEIHSTVLDRLSVLPNDIGPAEEFLRNNGLGHAWLEINNPAVANELVNAAPDAFRMEDGALQLIPRGRISNEGWAVIANHMNAVERARVGIS